MRHAMLSDFRTTVLRYWPLEDLADLGVAPTNYVDDDHAFAFLPFGMTENATRVAHRRLMSGIILPMLWEGGQWQVDLPSWRFMEIELRE
jgi:hypothetical protein